MMSSTQKRILVLKNVFFNIIFDIHMETVIFYFLLNAQCNDMFFFFLALLNKPNKNKSNLEWNKLFYAKKDEFYRKKKKNDISFDSEKFIF